MAKTVVNPLEKAIPYGFLSRKFMFRRIFVRNHSTTKTVENSWKIFWKFFFYNYNQHREESLKVFYNNKIRSKTIISGYFKNVFSWLREKIKIKVKEKNLGRKLTEKINKLKRDEQRGRRRTKFKDQSQGHFVCLPYFDKYVIYLICKFCNLIVISSYSNTQFLETHLISLYLFLLFFLDFHF